MTIFTVIVTDETAPGNFQRRLTERFPADHLIVKQDVWLVAGRDSARGMSDQLGMTDGSVANGIVTSVSGYFGRAPANVWDWIKAKWEETSANE